MKRKILDMSVNFFLMIINIFLIIKYLELIIGFYDPFMLEHLLNLFWGQFGAGVIFAISEGFQVGMPAVPVLAGIGLFMAWVIGREINKVKKTAYWTISLLMLIIINMIIFPLVVRFPVNI